MANSDQHCTADCLLWTRHSRTAAVVKTERVLLIITTTSTPVAHGKTPGRRAYSKTTGQAASNNCFSQLHSVEDCPPPGPNITHLKADSILCR